MSEETSGHELPNEGTTQVLDERGEQVVEEPWERMTTFNWGTQKHCTDSDLCLKG